MDGRLANPVRSGRKQPQRVPARVVVRSPACRERDVRRAGRLSGLVATAVILHFMPPPAAHAADTGKIALTFANWVDAEDTTRPGTDKIIQDFEQAHANIPIKNEAILFSEIVRQLVVRRRNAPPVFVR